MRGIGHRQDEAVRLEALRDCRVLVTGGLGFLGLNLVPSLLASGARVRLLNRSLDPLACRWLERLAAGRPVELVQGDIADAERMAGWLASVDLVLNLAGESGAVKSGQQAETDMHVNVAGHLNLLNAIRDLPVPPRVVFASSRLVYGITGATPVCESHPPQPTSLYGLHKLTVEHYHRIYRRHYGIPFTALRLTNPYGPYQLPQRHHYGILNRFVMTALRGETLRLFGGGPQLRDYIHVADVAEAILRSCLLPATEGETLNLGAGVSHSLGTVAGRIVDLAGAGRIESVAWPAGYEKVETGDFLCDTSRFERLVGWRPRIGLEDGLRATMREYREPLA